MTDIPAATSPAKHRRRRHLFRWVFLAIQALFLIWIIAGGTSAANDKSSCGTLSDQTCHDAAAAGAGIGIFLIIVFWAMVDIILGITYLIVRKR